MARIRDTLLFTDANLLFYVEFEGNSNDSKGSNHGTDTSVTYSSTDGKYLQHSIFNGTSSNITFGSNIFSNAQLASGSISLWFKQNGIPSTSDRHIFNIEGFVTIEIETSTGYIKAQTDGNPTFATKSTNVCDNSWHNIVVTWTSGNTSLYLDGGTAVTAVPTGSPNVDSVSRAIRAGSDHSGSTNFYPGRLDDLAVFSDVLTSDEIANINSATGTTTSTSSSTSTTTTSTSTTTTSTSTTTTSTSTTTTSTSITTTSTTTTSTSTTTTSTSTTTTSTSEDLVFSVDAPDLLSFVVDNPGD